MCCITLTKYWWNLSSWQQYLDNRRCAIDTAHMWFVICLLFDIGSPVPFWKVLAILTLSAWSSCTENSAIFNLCVSEYCVTPIISTAVAKLLERWNFVFQLDFMVCISSSNWYIWQHTNTASSLLKRWTTSALIQKKYIMLCGCTLLPVLTGRKMWSL